MDITYEFVLAVALLTAPKDVPLDKPDSGWIEAIRHSVIATALEAEILDPRETSFFLVQMQDYAGDMQLLLGRSHDLANAPMLEEAKRFPDLRLINEFLSFNRSYRNDLQARLAVDTVHALELEDAIAEVDQLYHLWDTVRDARCEYYFCSVRRDALQLLRELVGPERFYSGQLPSHVPTWHFAGR